MPTPSGRPQALQLGGLEGARGRPAARSRGSACTAMSTSALARVAHRLVALVEAPRGVQALDQRVGNRLAGLPVARVLLAAPRARSSSARTAATAARRSRAAPACPTAARRSRRTAARAGRGRTRGTACARRPATAASARPARPWRSCCCSGSPAIAWRRRARCGTASASVLIQAPLRLLARAKLSCRKTPTTAPAASRTS